MSICRVGLQLKGELTMTKSNESINKAMLQMIIDNSNGKKRMKCGAIIEDEMIYKGITDGYTLFLLPERDCYITFPTNAITETFRSYIPNIDDDAATIDTNIIVTIQPNSLVKAFKAYPTNTENVYIKCDLLKGFGNSFTIKETENKYMFAVEIAGNIRGFVMGCKGK